MYIYPVISGSLLVKIYFCNSVHWCIWVFNPVLSPQIREHQWLFAMVNVYLVYSIRNLLWLFPTLVNHQPSYSCCLDHHSAAKEALSFQSMPEFTVPRCLVLNLKQQVLSTVLTVLVSLVPWVCGWQMEFKQDLPIGNVLKWWELLLVSISTGFVNQPHGVSNHVSLAFTSSGMMIGMRTN